MSKITNGTVKYGRMVRPADFENKTCEVTLSFTIDDGESHQSVVEAALKEAHAKVHAMLGIRAPAAAAETAFSPPKEPIPGQKETAAARLNAAEVEKPKGEPGRPKVEKPAETKPAATEGEDLGDSFDEDADEAQVEIPDTALSAAMNRKVAELKPAHGGAAPKLIKELINKFVEPPKKSHDIPQNLRADFLKKLEALK